MREETSAGIQLAASTRITNVRRRKRTTNESAFQWTEVEYEEETWNVKGLIMRRGKLPDTRVDVLRELFSPIPMRFSASST